MTNSIKETFGNIMAMLITQALLFILLGIGVIAFPKLLNFMFAIVFIVSGISLFSISLKLRKFYKKTEELWKKFGV